MHYEDIGTISYHNDSSRYRYSEEPLFPLSHIELILSSFVDLSMTLNGLSRVILIPISTRVGDLGRLNEGLVLIVKIGDFHFIIVFAQSVY